MLDPLIEREYNLRIRHPERDAVYARFAAASAALRARWPGFRTIPYGDSPRQAIDFFPAAAQTQRAPLFVFIHGGYWRALERGMFSFLAEAWLARGVHVALPGYDLAPAVGVRTIASQVRRSLERLLEAADALRIDRANIVVSGHSAGAHLGALVLGEMRRNTARGFAGVSGVYALEPLLATSVNADVHLDVDEARALSPQRRAADPAQRHLCAVGGAETDGFRGQTHEYVVHLRALGARAEAFEVPGRTHFDILDDLADPERELFRRVWSLLDPPGETA
ncbi:MAG TPA: alpha/beta hydrolase [Caldimonas sp.]|nr:alpha/beta hydrolase [Caldimonas sp.]